MAKEEFGLSRVLGLGALVAIEVGTTIGAGVFVLSGIALKWTGPSLPLAYFIAGIPVLLVMLSIALIGSALPTVGGTYRYPSRLFSSGWAFVSVWGYAMGMVFGGFPLYALRSVQYLLEAFPQLSSLAQNEFYLRLGAIVILTLFYLANCRGLSIAVQVQAVMVVMLIVALLYYGIKGIFYVELKNFHPFLPGGFKGLVSASALLTFAFLGSNSVIELGGEIKEPTRNVPRSLLISIPLVALIYITIALACTGVMPWEEGAGKLLTVSAERFMGRFGYLFFVLGGAFLAITTTLNATFMWATKSMLVVSRDGLIPSWVSEVHPRFHTPHRFLTIIWALAVLSLLFKVPAGTFETYASIGGLLIFIPLMFSVLLFPKKLPIAYERAGFKLKGIWLYLCSVTGMLLSLVCIVMLLSQLKIMPLLFFIIWLVLGGIYYSWNIRRNQRIKELIKEDLRNWSASI